jgi:hypothetical protein
VLAGVLAHQARQAEQPKERVVQEIALTTIAKHVARKPLAVANATQKQVSGRNEQLRERARAAEQLVATPRQDPDLTALTSAKPLACSMTADAHGEFVHFYTRTVGTVFFEFVERRGHYDGYGADNAPVRLAAQRGWRVGTVRA